MKKIIFSTLLLLLYGSSLLPAQVVEIHHIAVGAGDATLIKINNRTPPIALLIDAGVPEEGTNVFDYLNDPNKGHLKVNPNAPIYLDYAISSHYHSDHIGGFLGVPTVQRTGNTEQCFYPNGVLTNDDLIVFAILDKGSVPPLQHGAGNPTRVFQDYQHILNPSGRRVQVGTGTNRQITPPTPTNPPSSNTANQQLALGGTINLGTDINGVPITLRLIVSNGYLYNPRNSRSPIDVATAAGINRNNTTQKQSNWNNWGLAWVLEYGKFRYFTGGDMGGANSGGTINTLFADYLNLENPVSQMLPQLYRQPTTVPGHICALKINHHGSAHSSCTTFLNTLKPTAAVISCGTLHQHPTQEVLNRLQASSWNLPGLSRNFTNYWITELYQDRYINTARGITSGNISYTVTAQAVNPTLLLINPPASMPAPNNPPGFLYEVNNDVNGPNTTLFKGHVVIKVDAVSNHVSIASESRFQVQSINYETGNWETQQYNCHQ